MSAYAGADTRGELSTDGVPAGDRRDRPRQSERLPDPHRRRAAAAAGHLRGRRLRVGEAVHDGARHQRRAAARAGGAARCASTACSARRSASTPTDRAKHDAFRHLPGAWDGAVRATRVLTDAGLDFSLHMSVTDWNVGEVPAMIDLAQRARRQGAELLLPGAHRPRHATSPTSTPPAYERILTYLAKAQGVGRAGRRRSSRRMLGMGGGAEPAPRRSRIRGRRRSGAPTGCSSARSARRTSGASSTR